MAIIDTPLPARQPHGYQQSHSGIEKVPKQRIFRIVVEAKSGKFMPGDDPLFIIVAGDVRENVKPVLAKLLDRIKAEAVTKRGIGPGV